MTVPGQLLARGSRSAVHTFGDGAVVKVPFASTPDGWIEYEAEYAEAARTAGAPVPVLLGLETVGGRRASVWERVGGQTLWQAIAEEGRDAADAGRLLAEVHRALHQVSAPIQLPRQVDRLASKLRGAAARVGGDVSDALALLGQVRSTTLCHGDLHPGNVLLGPHGPVVLDWFDAARGEALADIARSWLTMTPEGSPQHQHLPGARPRQLVALVSTYTAAMGVDLDDPDGAFSAWAAVQAAARISEQVDVPPLLAVWKRRRAALVAASSTGLA